MNKIKGPAIFLAQFIQDVAPYNSLAGLCRWAASLGYKVFNCRRGTIESLTCRRLMKVKVTARKF